MTAQPAVLAPVPAHASFLFFRLRSGVTASSALADLGHQEEHVLIGLGPTLLHALGVEIDGVRPLPTPTGQGVPIPRTPADLMARISGPDPGVVLHRERALVHRLFGFDLVDRVDAFVHGPGLDLTGYEDGTENPVGDEAVRVALMQGRGPGLDGSTVVAVQRWVHDLDTFGGHEPHERDAIIGRRHEDNAELPDAPESAHVKRTAQEDFEPEAFLVRRSMPWRDHRGAGLVFVAFAASLDAFEAQLRRMTGVEDGVVDALFSFTHPVTGAVFWCPPMRGSSLDLSAVRGD